MPDKRTLFQENPHDIEAIFECLQIASNNNKHLAYIDRLVAHLRLDPDADLINLNYRLLHDLQLLKLNEDRMHDDKPCR